MEIENLYRRELFLKSLAEYVKSDIGVVPYIFKTIEIGIRQFELESEMQIQDYESAIHSLLNPKSFGSKSRNNPTQGMRYAKRQIKKYVDKNKTYMDWPKDDSYFE